MTDPILAVDFGTSNSAAAILQNGQPRRLHVEQDADTLPTAVFFPDDHPAMLIGRDAARALIDGEEGRYMRALKSVLGTGLFHEKRLIGKTRRTLADIVTAFLIRLRTTAEAQTGMTFQRVISGRPVAFHTADPDRDAKAEADLRACYHAAGFQEVVFMLEPEAAALASQHGQPRAETGLIVDIGGGTSDFTVYRSHDDRTVPLDILASHGIRLGGTDFDHALSMAQAMPLLGLGGTLRRAFGDGLLPVPRALYVDLSTWAKIPFVYGPETERQVVDMSRHASAPAPFARLSRVIKEQLGHELAFAVESGKIAANAHADDAAIAMGFIEPGLSQRVNRGALNAALAPYREALRIAMFETLKQAGIAPSDLDAVVLVGGSSLMDMIEEEAQAIAPHAALRRSDAFTAVIDGLALATAR